MNISDMEIGQVVYDKRGTQWYVVGQDSVGKPRKPGPLLVLSRPGHMDHRHVDQKEFSEFTREPK